MYILVLDTIHGGGEIAQYLEESSHICDTVDVYRHKSGISLNAAEKKKYDLIVAPVHLDPKHPLLNYSDTPVISHHMAVSMILKDKNPRLSVEITGSRGKTTTAFALSSVLSGAGILHTSKGTFKIPETKLLFKKSITPASVIRPALMACDENRWLVAEESLGVCRISDLCILTSDENYAFAAGRKYALEEKIRSAKGCKKLLLSYNVKTRVECAIYASDIVSVKNDTCTYSYENIRGSFSNPLLLTEGYCGAIATAAAAGCILGEDPKNLENFRPVEGRMSVSKTGNICIIDNSNSGVNKKTAVMAADYAKKTGCSGDMTLVIGIEAENICEGFCPEDVMDAVRDISPKRVVIVGNSLAGIKTGDIKNIPVYYEDSLDSGREKALEITEAGAIVLCVKTWR